jgi:predicted DNA-binding transcriptional regulator YafY
MITLMQSDESATVQELAQELQVSRRTVFRDLNMLELAHIPYYFDKQRNSYRINRNFFLPPINLDLTEALSILLMATRRSPSAGAVPWAREASRAAMKLESALPASVREHIGSALGRMEVRLPAAVKAQGLDDLVDRLSDAAGRHRVCQIVYLSFYERRQLRELIHPLRLLFVQRAWYVLAWSQREAAIRTYKLARVKKLTLEAATFTPPPAKQVDDHLAGAWSMIPEGRLYDVHLHFDRQVAGNVAEVLWHPTQQVSWRDDGSIDFSCRVDGLGEISWWILGYGDHARVQGPPALARRLRDVARRMVSLYDSVEA